MRLASLLLLVTAAAGPAFLAGCSSGSGGASTADGGSDAEAATDGGGGAVRDGAMGQDAPPGDAATTCNTLSNVASTVSFEQVAQDPPQPQGGTIADGTYTLTAATIYTGPGGPTGASGSSKVTVQISGTTIQVVTDGSPPTKTVTLATSGSTLTASDTCPDTSVTHGSYTATAATLLIFLDGGTDDAGARTLVETFTRQ